MTGKWPTEEVDHRDCDPSNDRWENLREATSSQNKANRRSSRGGRNLPKGVSVHYGKFQARITINYKTTRLGVYPTIEQAAAAYANAAVDLHGEFACTGEPEEWTAA
jgi:hypothetical protein